MTFYKWSELIPKLPKKGIKMKVVTGERVQMVLFEIEPNVEFPEHSHPHEQMGTVLEGKILLKVGDEEKVLEAGDVYIAPPNVKHSAKTFDERAVVLDVFSPPRQEYK
ncbi:MAG: cupin domain-containing protein [Deferribacteres bacterium]|nr:cupin domain-containing protein [Deferribacteres bacterium]